MRRRVAWTLAAALLVSIHPFQVTAQPVAAPRLVLSEVGIDAAPQWSIHPDTRMPSATAATLRVVVDNIGDRTSPGYTLAYHWSKGGVQRPLNEDEARSLDVREPLEGRRGRVHEFTWRLQEGQEGQGTLVVVLEGTNHEEKRLQVMVPVHDISVTVTARDTPAEIGLEGTAFWPILIHNHGNVDESILMPQVKEDHPLVDELLLPLAGLTVRPGQHAEFRLGAHYPGGAPSDFSQPYTVTARVASMPEVTVTRPVGTLDIRHSLPSPARDASMTATTTGTLFAGTGVQVDATFRLTNLGAAAEGYRLTPGPGGGWTPSTPTVNGQPVTDLVLAAGEPVDVTMRITPPTGPDGLRGTASLAAIPWGGGDAVVAQQELRLPGPAPVVDAIASLGPGPYVGDPLRLSVSVTNVGDANMPAPGTVTLAVTFPDGSSSSLPVAIDALRAGESGEAVADLGPAPAAGTLVAEASVVPGPPDAAKEQDLTVWTAGLSLRPPVSLPGNPGEAVLYLNPPHAFSLTNLGDRRETVLIEVTQGAGEFGDVSSLTLDPGEQRNIGFRHGLPSRPGPVHGFNVTLRASLASAAHHAVEATASTTILDLNPPRVAWAPPLPQAWVPGTPLPLEATIDDETAVASVQAVMAGPRGTQNVTVPAEGPWKTHVTFPGEGTYNVSMRAIDIHGNNGTTGNHPIMVLAEVPPQITGLLVRGNGTEWTAQGRILAPVPILEAVLLVDDLGPVSLALSANGSFQARLALAPGHHNVTVRATDSEGRVGTAQTSVVVASSVTEEAADPPGSRRAPEVRIGMLAPLLLLLACFRRGARRQEDED